MTDNVRQIPLAIIGMACRLPGAATLDAFWSLLADGRCSVGELPAERFDRASYYDPQPEPSLNKSYTARGGVVDATANVGESVLPPRLARSADPTHRLMAEVAAESLRHAGLDPFHLPRRDTGVYVGHTIGSDAERERQHQFSAGDIAACLSGLAELNEHERSQLCEQLAAELRSRGPWSDRNGVDTAAHMSAAIVSKAFGLTGPWMAVNAACASSLQALAIAGRALQLDEIDMAIVGGSSVCSRDWLVLFSQAKALSRGESYPFDHRADGLLVSEATVSVVVKRLDRALADGNPIQSVLCGIGMASDGRGRSLWAPKSAGQVAAIRRAYASPAEMAAVQMIEAHATATPLGDATEIASLTEAFGPVVQGGNKISVSSAKANLGHTLEAAGLVGIIKTTLCLQKGIIPGAIGVERLNTKVDWAQAPVQVPLKTIAWPDATPKQPRRAGVSAFGIGGLNVHVALSNEHARESVANTNGTLAATITPSPIAIVGIGCVLPGARGVKEFRGRLQAESNRSLASPARHRVEDFNYDWQRHRIAPKEIELADPLQFMTLEAADQALARVGSESGSLDREKTAVVVGSEFASDFGHRLQLTFRLHEVESALRARLANRGFAAARVEKIVSELRSAWHAKWPVLQDNSGSYSASSLAVRISKAWDLMGGAFAVDSGATSGMTAIDTAANLLRAGDANTVVCATAQRSFDCGRQASSGEGAVVFVLKRLEDAVAAGDRVEAVLRGPVAVHDDAPFALRQAIAKAAAQAGIEPGKISLLFCGGAGDSGEQAFMTELHGLAARGAMSAPRSTAQHFGNLRGASAGVSLLAAIVTLQQGSAGSHGENGSAAKARTSQATHHDSVGKLAAVISHDQGLAYCAILEQAAAAVDLPANTNGSAASHSLSGGATKAGIREVKPSTNGAAKRLRPEQLEAAVIAEVAELTGYPIEVLDLDADLSVDLDIHPHELPQIVRRLQERAGVVPHAAVVGSPRTLREVARSVAGASAASEPVAEPVTDEPVTSEPEPVAMIAKRSRLSLVSAPPQKGTATPLDSTAAALLLGDNPAAALLAKRLQALGMVVHQIAAGAEIESALAAIEQLPAAPAVRHVFVMTSLDARASEFADAANWQLRRTAGLEFPTLALQKWRQSLLRQRVTEPLTIVAATMLGGDLGVAQRVVAPEGGWIAGLLKTINVELHRQKQSATVKVCDFAGSDTAEQIVDGLLGELASGSPEVEVALGGGQRRVVKVIAEPAVKAATIQRGGTWIVTGGARGITAEVAIMLGQRYGLNLHLIGRSAAPSPDAAWRNCSADELKKIKQSIVRQAIAEGKSPEKQWDRVKNDIEVSNNLERMRQLGVRIHYHSCDVSDWQSLEQVLQNVRRQSGPIVGIVHGAGYARTNRFEAITRGDLASTLDAKVSGAVALMQLTRQDPLAHFIGFGSISGRFGGNGLGNYAAANDMLAKLCTWYRHDRPDCATTCIEWQSWDQVGMAMLPDSKVGTRGLLKMQFIQPQEGVEHLRRELEAGLPAAEVLIDDGQFEQLQWLEI